MLWTEYPKKESAALDEDELIQLDSSTKTNKRFTLSVLYEWILSKIKKQEFSVSTSAKTIDGSINELKSSLDSANKKLDSKADSETVENELSKKANGAGITFSINDSGGLRVTYNSGKE